MVNCLQEYLSRRRGAKKTSKEYYTTSVYKEAREGHYVIVACFVDRSDLIAKKFDYSIQTLQNDKKDAP